jgi:hypothetical protein
MRHLEVLLSTLATLVYGLTSALGHTAILCIGIDGHIAIEDGTALCCTSLIGKAPTRGVTEKCCSSEATDCLAHEVDSQDAPCEDCRDLRLPSASDRRMRDDSPRVEQASQFWTVLPFAAGPDWSPASAFAASQPLNPSPTDTGGHTLADLRTVVLRC